MTGERVPNIPENQRTPDLIPKPLGSSLTNRIYGIFQIQDVSVIEEIAEHD